mmetsp:Transcript_5065/g.12240  ORF Transcript_5065/g.12240 Transcript_5065/m.12240 type:complete len:410 (+) Transcript_5065:398-1627(+)
MKNQINELEGRLAATQKHSSNIEESYEKLSTEWKETEVKYSLEKSKRLVVEKELSEQNELIKTMKNDIEKLKLHGQASERELEAVSRQLQDTSGELAQASKLLEYHRDQLNMLEKENTHSRSVIENMSVGDMEQKDIVQRQHESLHDYLQKLRKAEKKAAILEEQNDVLKEAMLTYQEQYADAKQKLGDFTTMFEEKSELLEQTTLKRNQSLGELNQFSLELEELKLANSKLQAEHSEMKEIIALNQLTIEKNARLANEAINSLKTEKSELISQLKTSRADTDKALSLAASLKDTISQKSEEIASLIQSVDKLRAIDEENIRLLKDLDRNNGKLRSELLESRRRVDELKTSSASEISSLQSLLKDSFEKSKRMAVELRNNSQTEMASLRKMLANNQLRFEADSVSNDGF